MFASCKEAVKLRSYLEKTSLNLEEEKEIRSDWDAGNNSRTNLGRR
jgi:hypothetical protein